MKKILTLIALTLWGLIACAAPAMLYSPTTVANLPYLNPSPSPGSLIWITDGSPNTNPCLAGGAGAFALFNSSGWSCITIAAQTPPASSYITTPNQPTFTYGGTPGSTVYGYSIVALGVNGYVNHSLPSPLALAVSGNATLSNTNYVTIQTSAVVNSYSCDVYRITGGTYNGKIGNIPCGNAFNDTSTKNADGTTPALTNTSSAVQTFTASDTLGGRLRDASSAALAGRNPWNNPWLILPSAWVQGTAYTIGTLVTANGNVYLCTIAGTSLGSGGGPALATAPPITDNTVTWQYFGTTPTASALPGEAIPTVTLTASNPPAGLSSTAPQLCITAACFATNLTATGGPTGLTINNSNGGGGFIEYTTNYPGGSASQENRVGNVWQSISFQTDSPKFAIKMNGGSVGPMTIIIDSQFVNPGNLWTTAAYPEWVVVDYTTSAGATSATKVRTVEVDWQAQSNVLFGGVAVDATHQMWPVNFGHTRIRVCAMGDSITQGGNTYPLLPDGNWPGVVSKYMGWSDIWNVAEGGTGFIATNGANGYSYIQHITDCTNYNPDVFILMDNINDESIASTSAITAAELVLFKQIRLALPSAPIIIIGSWPSNTGPSATRIATEAALAAAVTQFGDSNTYFIPVTSDPAGAWISGTGKITAQTGTGNADIYLGSDGIHPTDRGILYDAMKIANALRGVVALIP